MAACTSQIYRLNPTGGVIKTYSTNSVGEISFFFAMNLEPDDKSFWTAGYSSGMLYQFDIESGNKIIGFDAGILGGSLAGIGVYKEVTSGLLDNDGDGIPDSIETAGSYDYKGLHANIPGGSKDHKDIYVYYDWLKGVLSAPDSGDNSFMKELKMTLLSVS